MAEQPTQEQIKEFWEWCGFNSRLVWSDPADIGGRHQFKVWDYPDGSGVTQHLSVNPPIDLNNLFKYAVPKCPQFQDLARTNKGWLVTYISGYVDLPRIGRYPIFDEVEAEDPALALFWALWQVREVSNSKEEKH